MKRISLLCTMLVALGMAFVSCNDSNDDNGNGVSAIGTGTLVVSVKASTDVPGVTRGTSDTDASVGGEATINNYEVFVFSSSAVANSRNSATPIAHKAVSSNSETLIEGVPAEALNIVVVTNFDGLIGSAVTYETLIDMMSSRPYSITGGVVGGNAAVTYTSGFEMTGEVTNYTPVVEASNAVTIPVIRLVSKHNQPNILPTNLSYSSGVTSVSDINTLFGVTSISSSSIASEVTFTPTRYALVNGRVDSKLFAAGAGPSVGFTYWNSVFDENGAYQNNYTAPDFIAFADTSVPIYAFENVPAEVLDTSTNALEGYDASTVYAFIIEGELTYRGTGTPTNGSTATRYWRINLGKTTGTEASSDFSEDHYQIFRNGSYYLTVNNIYTHGYETPQQAEEEDDVIPVNDDTTIVITLQVMPWDYYVTETDM